MNAPETLAGKPKHKLETNFEIGRACEADKESILELEHTVWGGAEEATAKYFDWLTIQNPPWTALTHVARDESGDVISMHVVLPVPAVYKGEHIKAGISLNIATDPRHRRKGLSIQVAKSIYEEARRLGIKIFLSVPNSTSIGLFLTKNGFQDLRYPRMVVRWIDPSTFLAEHGFLALGGLAQFLGIRFIKRRVKNSDLLENIRFLENIDSLKLDNILEPAEFCLAPDVEWLKWRYMRHPFRKYEFVLAGKETDPQALVVFHILEQYRRALIMEFFVAQNIPVSTVSQILDSVAERCRIAGCSSLISLAVAKSRKAGLLRAGGFWAFPFSSVWKPKIVVGTDSQIQSRLSIQSIDVSYGSLINIE
ncbi:MAG: GNAT family N-acetyltransferase [Desulfomonilaceae bacterium]